MAKQDLCADNCGKRATWKPEYLAYLNANCIEKMERQVQRRAVLDLRKVWREKAKQADREATTPGNVAERAMRVATRLAYRSER